MRYVVPVHDELSVRDRSGGVIIYRTSLGRLPVFPDRDRILRNIIACRRKCVRVIIHLGKLVGRRKRDPAVRRNMELIIKLSEKTKWKSYRQCTGVSVIC